ncbi:TFIID and and SAGA complex TAF10 subunit, putative [Talaromyces stipitatus ATCC 10500]|uniref:TFIID and and SAGA complex TAF10 subunit, putative n=1 Tax=Talaromyces stipitatus (strain ATCC 10500 / CBS 375.48 / QM 6759 / NRRL 1006) TaxID=441959 RepID=B8LTG7_TALSN|nr:TFIID and and SAGA complex TAF10 subunit, putative [Talaromyces stipitatus ATCC 10500]EED23045.1 TFIID and and SAGA complex TAF10 subunit, putative [Talaromyces stipitatus ATCC 10500]
MADSSTNTSQSAAGSQLPPSSTQPTTQSTEALPSSSETVTASTQQGAGDATTGNRDIDLGGGDPLDNDIDNDIDMNNTDDMPTTTVNGTNDAAASAANALASAAAAPPIKKESSLREFLGKMDEYAPIIPDAVTAHYLTVAGLPPPGNGPNQTPPHLARLLALATQKFVADIAADAYQYSRIRASNSSTANNPMGGLNAAAGLNAPNAAGGAGGAGAAGAGGDAGKKSAAANTHLGIQRPGFGGGGQGGSGQGRTVLTMEDLGMAVSEYGVSIKRGEFYR